VEQYQCIGLNGLSDCRPIGLTNEQSSFRFRISGLVGGAENAGRENDGREIDGPTCMT